MSTIETLSPEPLVVTEAESDSRAITITPAKYLQRRGWSGRVFALLLLFVSLPVIAILVAIVRLTSRGPGLYRQVRVGKDGPHLRDVQDPLDGARRGSGHGPRMDTGNQRSPHHADRLAAS